MALINPHEAKETAEAELEKAKLSVVSEKKSTGQQKKKPVS